MIKLRQPSITLWHPYKTHNTPESVMALPAPCRSGTGTKSDPAGLVPALMVGRAERHQSYWLGKPCWGPQGGSCSHPSPYDTPIQDQHYTCISYGSPCRSGTKSDPAPCWPGLMRGMAESHSYWCENLVGDMMFKLRQPSITL